MFKKILTTTVAVSALVFGVSNSAFAGFQFIDNYNKPYADAGISAYYLNDRPLEVGTLSNAAPLGKIQDHKFIPQFTGVLGYQFLNCNENWLTRLIGNEQAIEAKINYYNTTNSTRKSNLGTGSLWTISGQEIVHNVTIYNFNMRSHQWKTDLGLYFKGHRYTTNRRFSMTPYTGIVYTHLQQSYVFDVNYSGGAIVDKDKENYDIKTQYYGISLGNTLDYQVWKTLSAFVDLEAQLLHANAELKATQDPIIYTDPSHHYTVHDTGKQDITYRAILSGGVKYKFRDTPSSISLELRGGLDRWDYVPVIVSPNSTNSPATHIHGDTQNNGFVMLTVHVPIG